MRIMTSTAAFEFLYAVFKNPGASLFRVTFVADVGIEFIYLSQTRSCPTSMGGMAVGAIQCPLDDAMVVGKIKFGFNISVTRKTEIGILFLQEIFGNLLRVNLMAVIASHST